MPEEENEEEVTSRSPSPYPSWLLSSTTASPSSSYSASPFVSVLAFLLAPALSHNPPLPAFSDSPQLPILPANGNPIPTPSCSCSNSIRQPPTTTIS
eukprot:c55390_g1_i1 orf=281-571(-)